MPKKKTHSVDVSLKPLLVPMDQLNMDPRNARKHSERNLDAVAKSMEEFGQDQPLVVQKQGMVIRKGNARYAAACKLGWDHIAAVIVDESDIRATARAIADNRTAELAEWDDPILAESLAELQKAVDFDHEVAGFTDGEIDQLVAKVCGVEVVEDEVPEPPADPVTKPGDLWLLGDHRVLCGDATSEEDVGRVLDGHKPFIMVTDPPYGVEYDPEWRQDAAEKGLIGFSPSAMGTVKNDDRQDWTDAYRVFPGHVAYVWHAGRFAADLVVNLRDAGFEIRTQLIWRKSSFAISRGHYHWQHEPCWYAVRSGGSAKWCGDRSQSTVWDIPHVKNETGHGTQKPVECMARPIRNHGDKGDDVYDPFLGSGTTLIAAEQLGRVCYGLEIDPKYCDVIVERWENLTGKKAKQHNGKASP